MKPLDDALALAASGCRVFFCNANKRPCCPNGFKDAESEPAAVKELYRKHPGPLLAIVTGEILDVLDIDKKHIEGVEWFQQHRNRIPKTRTHRTRGGGLHFLVRRHAGLRNWAGWPVLGVDCRAGGGYAVWWPAAGKSVLDDTSPAVWPEWLIEQRLNSFNSHSDNSAFSLPAGDYAADRYAEAAIRSAVDRVKSSGEGSRNHTLNSEAYGMARLVKAGVLGGQETADALAAAAMAAGLSQKETIATLKSAFRARGI